MADTVNRQVLVDNNKRTLIKYVIISDGAAAANTNLISFSELRFAKNATGAISNTNPRTSYGVTLKRVFGYSKTQNAAGYTKFQWLSDSNTVISTWATNSFDYNVGGSVNDGANGIIPSPDANTRGLSYATVSPTAGDTSTFFVELHKDSKDYDAGQTADPAAFNSGNFSL